MAVKFIKPEPIKLSEITRAIDQGLQASGEIVKAEYALFTGTWEPENKPEWKERKPGSSTTTLDFTAIGGEKVKVTDRVWSYITADNPMVWVDDGTKPHKIRPKTLGPGFGGFLHFQTGHIAKTKPGQIASGPGARFGPFVLAKEVDHPGTDPRDISITIGEKAGDHLSRSIDTALDGVASI